MPEAPARGSVTMRRCRSSIWTRRSLALCLTGAERTRMEVSGDAADASKSGQSVQTQSYLCDAASVS